MKRELVRQKLVSATDRVNSSWSWPGSGGKNLTASLNRVFAGPGKQQKQKQTKQPICRLNQGRLCMVVLPKANIWASLLRTCLEMSFVGSSQTWHKKIIHLLTKNNTVTYLSPAYVVIVCTTIGISKLVANTGLKKGKRYIQLCKTMPAVMQHWRCRQTFPPPACRCRSRLPAAHLGLIEGGMFTLTLHGGLRRLSAAVSRLSPPCFSHSVSSPTNCFKYCRNKPARRGRWACDL